MKVVIHSLGHKIGFLKLYWPQHNLSSVESLRGNYKGSNNSLGHKIGFSLHNLGTVLNFFSD